MRMFVNIFVVVVQLCLSAYALVAQTPVNVSGHWEGVVKAPEMDVKIEFDLAADSTGVLAGTFGQPAQSIKGLPLSTIVVSGANVQLVVKGGAQASAFNGTVSTDGKSINGEVLLGEFSAPFTLIRTGDARRPPPVKTGRIDKTVEGVWKGTMTTPGGEVRVVLTVRTQADGIAVGTIVSPNGSGIEIPVGVTQTGSSVVVDVPTVGASFAAVVTGNELVGTWTQGASSLPLTLRREPKQ